MSNKQQKVYSTVIRRKDGSVYASCDWCGRPECEDEGVRDVPSLFGICRGKGWTMDAIRTVCPSCKAANGEVE